MLGALVTVLPRSISHGLATVGFAAIIGLSAYSYGFHKGQQHSATKHGVEALRASEAARALERQWQVQFQKAQHEAKIREDKIQADVDSVRAERDRLRKQLTANRASLPAVSRHTVIEYAATLGDIFEQCTKRLEEVARSADGHVRDVRLLSEVYIAP